MVLGTTEQGLRHVMNQTKSGTTLKSGKPVPGGPVPMSELEFNIGDRVRAVAERLRLDPENGRYPDWGNYKHEGKTGEYDADDDEDEEEIDPSLDNDFEVVFDHEITPSIPAQQLGQAAASRSTAFSDETGF